MIRSLFILLIALFISSSVNAESKHPILEEFYLGNEIKIVEDKPLQQIDIPFHVYESVKSDVLNDIRIFNASSGLVPHKVFAKSQDTQTNSKPIVLSKLVKNSQDMEKLIDKYRSTGIDINLNLRANDMQGNTVHQDVYIGELGEIQGNYAELLLDWEVVRDSSYFFTADVEIADDLEHWKTVAKGVKLAQLKTSDEIVKHNKIKLNRFKKKFYRITIIGEHRPEIRSAELNISNNIEQSFKSTDEISGTHDAKNKQHIFYQAPALIPIKQIQIIIEEDNVIAKCNVYSRETDDQNWRMRGSGVIYNIKNDDEILKHQTIEVSASSNRYWKIDLLTTGSGFEQKAPVLKFDWQPHTLLFVARGEGPFTLAYGSAKYVNQPASQNTLFQDVNDGNTDQMIGAPLIINEANVLGGDSVLREDLIKVTPKKLLLWGILVVGSLLLLWMAFSLLKTHSNNDDG